MGSLAINWQGQYASYERPEDWLPEFEKRQLSPWILGQMIYASHNQGHFLTRAAESVVTAGSSLRLKVEGITPLAPLAIIHGRLNKEPLGLFGTVVIPYEERLDALVRIPPDAPGGTYIFFAQQWEPGGQPAYPGGSLIYPSGAASVEVRARVEDQTFWQSFEPWSEDDSAEVLENIRRTRENHRR